MPNGVTKQTKSKWIKFWFASLDFKWLWLVAGSRYFQWDGWEAVAVLDEAGVLTIKGWGGGTISNVLKRVE